MSRPSDSSRQTHHAYRYCVHVASHERRRSICAVEFKAPHKLTLPELDTGLVEMDIARDVFKQNEDTSECHSKRLIAAVITQLYGYMISSGVKNGYICTGEAYLFLNIKDDPSVVQYFLSIPNTDVTEQEEYSLHRTAVAQVLAFTLNALASDPPSQKWYDAASKRPTWKGDDEPPLPLHALYELPSGSRASIPSTTEQRDLSSHSTEKRPAAGSKECSDRGAPREYCTMKCISGLVKGGSLDPRCPNIREHGRERHSLSAQQFTHQLHNQLIHNREKDFEQLDIRGRTCFLMKASLSTLGYTVVIKATTKEYYSRIKGEFDAYNRLRSLQGRYIPVCIGSFSPQIAYHYHGKPMAYMLILSWSGVRAQGALTGKDEFLHQKRDELLSVLRSHGVTHPDTAWRNILWNDEIGNAFIIDFEDVRWCS